MVGRHEQASEIETIGSRPSHSVTTSSHSDNAYSSRGNHVDNQKSEGGSIENFEENHQSLNVGTCDERSNSYVATNTVSPHLIEIALCEGDSTTSKPDTTTDILHLTNPSLASCGNNKSTAKLSSSTTSVSPATSLVSSSQNNLLHSNLTSKSNGNDKFLTKELFPSTTESASPSTPLISASQNNLLADKVSVPQSAILEKTASSQLKPAFDDIIHVIRHSSFRVGIEQPVIDTVERNVDVGKFVNVVRDELDRNLASPIAPKSSTSGSAADSHRKVASEMTELIKYLVEFNRSPGYMTGLSPIFTDDRCVAEAVSIAQKLRSLAEDDNVRQIVSSAVGNATASRGLEVAVDNIEDYCNEVENRLLARFNMASRKRELSTMRKCVKILSQFNRGSSYIHRYVGLCPMFNVEVMNADTELVLVYQGAKLRPSNVARGLTSIFKEITESVRKEAATIADVFPSLNDVMSILVQICHLLFSIDSGGAFQRVLEDRVAKLLEKLLLKPSLVSPPTMKGGLVLYLRLLVMAYEQTKELARDLRDVGCGDLDVEGLTESLFLPHKDMYIEYKQASLRQLYKSKMEELRTEVQQSSESSGTIGRCASASMASSHQQICASVVTEFVRWNEEAVSRCILFSSQPAAIAANVSIVFTCLLDQVERNLNVHRYPLISSTYRRLEFMHGSFSTELPCIGKVSTYITEGLDRARDSLTAAAAIRGKFVLGTSVSRRVADTAASTAEAVAAAGDSSFRSFMVSVQRCGSCVAFVQKYFTNSVSRLLLPVDGVHAASCEELATVMSSVDSAAYKGLQQCIEIVIAEVEHVLSTEQKVRDYRSPDDGIAPVHRPTLACSKVVFYLSRVLYLTLTAVQGLNKQAFLTELGNRLHEGLLNHWQKFSFNASGGLRLKCDITKYAEFVGSFNVPCVDEKFEQPGILLMLLLLKVSSLREPEHEVHSASRGLQESKTCSEAQLSSS